MYTLWTVTVDGGKGRELYGEDYADIFAINRLHYKAASPLECDHVSYVLDTLPMLRYFCCAHHVWVACRACVIT